MGKDVGYGSFFLNKVLLYFVKLALNFYVLKSTVFFILRIITFEYDTVGTLTKYFVGLNLVFFIVFSLW